MEFNNKFFIILLLFLIFFSINNVAAIEIGDNATWDYIQELELNCDNFNEEVLTDEYNEKEILSLESDEIIVNNWEELQYYCSLSDKDYSLILKEDTNFYPSNPSSSTNQIIINNNVKIKGSQGAYIGDESSRNVHVSQGTYVMDDGKFLGFTPIVVSRDVDVGATFEDITFKQCYRMGIYEDGILIQIDGGLKNSFKNCSFANNFMVGGSASAIHLKKGKATFENSSAINNTIAKGLINVYSGQSMVVRNSLFENNFAYEHSTCIMNFGNLIVYNTKFYKNRASSWAGGITTYRNGNTTIYNSEFKSNVAGWNGGALYTYNILNIYGTVFEDNNCTTNNGGGAIGACQFEGIPRIFIDACLFKRNNNLCWSLDSLSTTGTGRGGAISLMDKGSIEVRNSIFVANSASIGTAICAVEAGSYGSPDITIVNNTFINHTRAGDVLYTSVKDTICYIADNYYLNNSIEFSNLSLSVVDVGMEQATLIINASLAKPNNYESNILNKTLYDVYINNEYVKTVNSTIFAIDFGDLDICNVYVIPTISNRKTNELTLISTREYIFVSQNSGNDSNNGTTRYSPVYTIKKALELAQICKNIILLDGFYSEENIEVNYDVSIKGENMATLTNISSFVSDNNLTLKNININKLNGDTFIKQNSGHLTVQNCIFSENNLSALFDCSNVDISKSIFINNNALIIKSNGFSSIKDSIILNNSDVIQGSTNYTLDYNWWGNTLDDLSKPVDLNINCWIVLNITSNKNSLEQNEIALVDVSFYLNNPVSKYVGLPKIDFDINVFNGIILENSNSKLKYQLTSLENGGINLKYNDVNCNIIFEFLKSTPNISIKSGNIMFGDELVVKVTLPSDVDGNVSVAVGNLTQNSVASKTTVFLFSSLKARDYAITAFYSGDDKYLAQNKTVNISVLKYPSQTNMEIGLIKVGEDLTLSISTLNDATGNVTLKINNDNHLLILKNSKANYTIDNISRGDYVITAIYNGDEKYSSSVVSRKIEVDNFVSEMEISAHDIVYGETAVVNVKLNDDTTGNVSVTIDGITKTLEVQNGSVKFEIRGLEAGVNKNISVFYTGDNTYFNKTSSVNFTIFKANFTFNISSTDIKIGQDAVIHISVLPKTTGTFTINGDIITIPLSGDISYVIKDLEIGEYEVTASYNGNNYNDISNSTSFSVLEYPIPQWPNDGFDTKNTDKSPHDSSSNGEIIFKLDFDKYIVGSILIDSEGNFYVSTSQEIYSYNKFGEVRWIFTNDAVVGNFSGMSISRDVIIVPKSGDTLFFINQTTGEIYESSNIYQASSLYSPIVDLNANIYVSSEFNVKSESYKIVIVPYKIWEFGGDPILIDLGNYAPLTSPTVSDDLIVVLCEGRLRFIDVKTLDTISIKSGSFASVRPVIGGGNIVYVALKENIVAYDGNGVQLWKTKVTGGVGNTMVLDSNQALYHVNAKGLLYRYDLFSGKESKVSDLKVTSNVLIGNDGTLYFGFNNLFYALDSEGNVLWKSDLESNIVGSPVMDSDGLIYVTTDDNQVIALANAPLKDSDLKIRVDDIVKGQTASITVTWNSQATGIVTCRVNGEEITFNADDGKIIKSIQGLDIGYYDFEVSYSGDMRFKPTTVTKTFVVRSADDIANNIQFDGNKTFSFSLNNAEGNLTVKINDKIYSKVLSNGNASLTIDDLAPGDYDALVIYSGDNIYNGTNRTFSVSVPKFNVTLNEQITTENIVSKITVSLPADASGNLTLSVGTKKYTEKVTKGNAVIIVDDLPAGNYTATLTYSGDSNYESVSKKVSICPTKIPVILDDTNVNVESGTQPKVSIKLNTEATGRFTVDIDGEEYSTDISEDLVISDLEPGNYTGTLTYSGDKKYDKASYIISFEVINATVIENSTNITEDNSTNTTVENTTVKNSVSIIVSAKDITAGNDAVIEVKSSENSINITVIVNKTEYNMEGSGRLTITDLSIGDYTVIAQFAGDDRFNEATNSTAFRVLKVNIPVTDETISIPEGNSTEYSISLPEDATGTFTVTVDGKKYTETLTNGKATVNIPELSEGTHNITVTYSGDGKYEAITKTSVVNVPGNSTGIDNSTNTTVDNSTNTTVDNSTNTTVDNSTNTTVVKVDPVLVVTVGNVNVGESAVVNVKTSVEIDKVIVNVNDVDYELVVSNGESSLTIPDLAVGNYNVIVRFAGDDRFNEATNSTAFRVLKVNIPVTDETISIPEGNSTEYSISLPEDATGTFTVTVDGKKYTETLTNGKATVNIPELSEGTHNITVSYSGDGKYEAITKTSVVNVAGNSTGIDNSTNTTVDNSTNTTVDNSTNTTVDKINPVLIVSVDDINVGDSAVVNVRTSVETGKLVVNVNKVDYELVISNGESSLTIPDLAVGNCNVIVRFAGDDRFNEATNSTAFKVLKVNVPITNETISIPESDSTQYSISLPADATGTLTVNVDGKNYTETLVNGKATVNLPELTTGSHNITVTYSGDAKYSPITKSRVVVKAHVINLTGSNLDMLYTSGKYFKVRLTIDGQPFASQKVKITLNGKTYSRSTNANGYASIKIKLAPKTYTVKATYGNLTIAKKVTVKSIISAKNINAKRSAKTVKIKVTLKKVNNKYLKNKKITLKFNKKTFKAKTNKKGVATFTIKNSVYKKLKVNKKYTYQVIYGKNKVKKTIKFKK